MAKSVTMYNAYFGDCFLLENEGSNLLVDFGVHNCANIHQPTYTSRDKLIEHISNDIHTHSESLSVLITHFHADHICGLIHMYESGQPEFEKLFKKIYLPNVWDNPFTVVASLLEEMVLKTLLQKAGLSGTSASLFDLVECLCVNWKNVVLLSRGVNFENDKYCTLWPQKENMTKGYKIRLLELGIPNDLIYKLESLSARICSWLIDQPKDRIKDKGTVKEEIHPFREEYDKLFKMYQDIMKDFGDDTVRSLNKLNHKINIVFHDRECGDENVLFTGDVEKSHMKKIKNATDIPLHGDYKFIKVPHHGTRAHYFDYSGFAPTHVLIPNGAVRGRENDDAYKIDSRYGMLPAIHNCSNSNNCLCNPCCWTYAVRQCGGRDRELVFPSPSIIIR